MRRHGCRGETERQRREKDRQREKNRGEIDK